MPTCFSGHSLAVQLRTQAYLQHPDQLVSHARHTGTEPGKPVGARFLDPSTGSYSSGAAWFGHRGRAALEAGGAITLYVEFPDPLAEMEHHGVATTFTTTGKMVNASDAAKTHYFGYGGARHPGPSPVACSLCSGSWW